MTNLPLLAPGNPVGSTGNWLWDVQHTIQGFNFGPGWEFVNTGMRCTSSTGPLQ